MNCIKLVIMDADRTMTDGGVYIDNNGNEMKKFNIKDGLYITSAKTVG
jgi:3-deoxy-D-manno-octulosonate 8-phosphate phosphatase (KDO 8-P phosphatase)